MDIGNVQPAVYTGLDHIDQNSGKHETAASQREMIQAVKALSGTELFGQDSELTFVFDRHTHRALVRVISKRTGEVMMQIPPESVLRMAEEGK